MIKRLNNAKRQTNYLVCNIEVSDTLQLMSKDESAQKEPSTVLVFLCSFFSAEKLHLQNLSCHNNY